MPDYARSDFATAINDAWKEWISKEKATQHAKNDPASHKKCKSQRFTIIGFWEDYWDVKVTLILDRL